MLKRNFFLPVLAALLISLVIPNLGYTNDYESDKKERSEIKARELKEVEKQIIEIEDEEIKKVYKLLKSNSVLAAPTNENAVKILETRKIKPRILIVPMLVRDMFMNEEWKQLYSAKHYASFLPLEEGIIVINNYDHYGKVAKTISLLRESFLAYEFASDPYRQRDEEDYYYEELLAYAFQNKILSKIGKDKYKKILAKEIERITCETNVIVKASLMRYDKLIVEVFGKPVSDLDKDYLRKSVLINVAFFFIEKNYKKDIVKNKKIEFIKLMEKDF